MVSPQNPTAADVGTRTDRGFVREESIAVTPVTSGTGFVPAFHHFWSAVTAGTLAAMTFFVMSYALMIGCRVGVYNTTGGLELTWGSAIWMIVAAAIAYFIGGMVAGTSSSARDVGWLRGISVWGLSVPLTLLIGAFILMGSGLAYGANAIATGPLAEPITAQHYAFFSRSGVAWTVFISLLIGLVCAVLGAQSGNRSAVCFQRREA